MGTLAQDLRYALRKLRKSPGFTSVAIITLALGIGATTAIFSVVYGVLLRPLPYSNPNRIMAIFEVTTKGTLNRLADPNFDDFRDQAHSFQKMAKYSAFISPVSGAAQPSRSVVAHVTPDFFPVFRVQPIARCSARLRKTGFTSRSSSTTRRSICRRSNSRLAATSSR